MDIKTIGSIIRSERKSAGLSQQALANASGLSRVSVVNIETGHAGDIGVSTLMKITDVLSIPLFSEGKTMDPVQMVLGNVNTSYKKQMNAEDIKSVLVDGVIIHGLEGQIMHLVDETPLSMIVKLVKLTSATSGVQAKKIWKNLASIASETGSPKQFWKIFA